MDFKGDFRLLLVGGLAIAGVAWAVYNAGAVQELVGTGTNGYVTMIQGLEPPQARGSGTFGTGNFTANTGMAGGQPFYTPPM